MFCSSPQSGTGESGQRGAQGPGRELLRAERRPSGRGEWGASSRCHQPSAVAPTPLSDAQQEHGSETGLQELRAQGTLRERLESLPSLRPRRGTAQGSLAGARAREERDSSALTSPPGALAFEEEKHQQRAVPPSPDVRCRRTAFPMKAKEPRKSASLPP